MMRFSLARAKRGARGSYYHEALGRSARMAMFLLVCACCLAFGHSAMVRQDDHYYYSRLLQQDNVNDDLELIPYDLLLPDIQFEQDFLSRPLTVDLTSVTCQNLGVADVMLELQAPLGNGIPVLVNLNGINITCAAAYEYNYLVANGGGTVEVDVSHSNVASQIVLISPNIVVQPPNAVWFNDCTATIQLDRLEFEGDGTVGLAAQALNAAEPLLIRLLQQELGTALCNQLEQSEDDLATLLTNFVTQWEPYWSGSTAVSLNDAPSSFDDGNVPLDALDLTNPSSTNMGTLLDVLIREASDYLSGIDDDTGLLQVNVLLQENLVDPDTGNYVLEASMLSDDNALLNLDNLITSTMIGVLQVSLTDIVIENLGNAITRVDPVVITGPFTLRTGVALSNLTLVTDLQVTLYPLNSTAHAVTEIIPIRETIESLSLQVVVAMVTSEEAFGNLVLGDLLDTKNILGCALPAFDTLTVQAIQIDDFVMNASSSFATSTTWISNILESNATLDILNSALETILDGTDCVEKDISELKGTIDFRDLFLDPATAREYGGQGTEPYGNIAPLIKQYVDSSLLEADSSGQLGIVETLINPLTSDRSGINGTLVWENDLVNVDSDFSIGDGFAGRLQLSLSNVRIENLHSIVPPLTLLDPLQNEAYRTANAATLGYAQEPIRIGVLASFEFAANDDADIRNQVNIVVEFWDTDISTTLLLRIAEEYFFRFPIRNLFDIHCLASLLHTPELDARGVRLESSPSSLSLEKLQILLKGLRLRVECVSCSSEEVREISRLLEDPEKGRDAAMAIQDLIDFGLGLAEDDDSFLQLQVDRFLVEAAAQCELREEYDPAFNGTTYESFTFVQSSDSTIKLLMIMIAVIAGLGLATLVIVAVLRYLVSRRHRAWLNKLSREQLVAIYAAQHAEEEQDVAVNRASTSLFRNPKIPVFVRYFIPFVLLCNIALFLSGHFSLGGSVQIHILLAGEKIVVDNFYKFSIVQSAQELWSAGGIELAILIFLFSGVWPYTKLIITMILWFATPQRVSIRRRGSVLLWLDALGKWSMVDVFVMIISIVAFRVTIKSPDYSFMPENFYKIDLLVAPMWGLYANMTAQLVTQFSSHVIIHYHRQVEAASVALYFGQKDSGITESSQASKASEKLESSQEEEAKDSGVEALYESKYLRPHRGESEPLYVRNSTNILFMIGAVSTIVLVLLGNLLPSFSFENLGLVGLAIEFGQNFEEAYQDFSISTIAQLFMDQARFMGTSRAMVGHFSIVSLMVASTLVVPYVLIALLLLQLWYPVSKMVRHRIDVAIESFAAWQYMDVYLLSVIVASWQVGDISSFLVNPYCETLESTFAELVSYGLLDPDDAQCFSVRSRVEPAVYTLVAAVVILGLTMSFVTNAHRQIIYQSDTLARQKRHRNNSFTDVELTDEELCEKIHPVPLLLTDRFRWLLRT